VSVAMQRLKQLLIWFWRIASRPARI